MGLDLVKREAPPPTNAPKGLMSLAEIIVKSRLFGDAQQAAQAAIKVLAGHELGVGPVNSMLGVYMVKGRITYSANFMASLVDRSDEPGKPHRYRYEVTKLDNNECHINFYKRDVEDGTWRLRGPSPFTMEDAKRAGLGGDNWKKYPRNMLFARAMSNGCKWFCSGLFGGSAPYCPDEVDGEARIDEEGNWSVPVEVVPVVEPSMPLDALRQQVARLVEETNSDAEKLCDYFGVTSLDDLDADMATTAIQLLQAKLA